ISPSHRCPLHEPHVPARLARRPAPCVVAGPGTSGFVGHAVLHLHRISGADARRARLGAAVSGGRVFARAAGVGALLVLGRARARPLARTPRDGRRHLACSKRPTGVVLRVERDGVPAALAADGPGDGHHALRPGLCCASPSVWRRVSASHHRPHADRGVLQHAVHSARAMGCGTPRLAAYAAVLCVGACADLPTDPCATACTPAHARACRSARPDRSGACLGVAHRVALAGVLGGGAGLCGHQPDRHRAWRAPDSAADGERRADQSPVADRRAHRPGPGTRAACHDAVAPGTPRAHRTLDVRCYGRCARLAGSLQRAAADRVCAGLWCSERHQHDGPRDCDAGAGFTQSVRHPQRPDDDARAACAGQRAMAGRPALAGQRWLCSRRVGNGWGRPCRIGGLRLWLAPGAKTPRPGGC
ncbi:hypothetical protein COLO4_00562, partial [Corchorus olitorius]